VAQNFFEQQWDIRVGSPRKLFRLLHDYLTEHGYEHSYEPLSMVGAGIEGIATFQNSLNGTQKQSTISSWRKKGIVIGLSLLVVGLIFLIYSISQQGWQLGLASIFFLGTGIAIVYRSKPVKGFEIKRIIISLEGEAYRTSGKSSRAIGEDVNRVESQALDLASDVRIRVRAEQSYLNEEMQVLTTAPMPKELEEIQQYFDKVLPEITLPIVK